MSKIEWTEKTWNPIVGCSVVSPGCTNCYAMKMAARLERIGTVPHYAGTTRTVNGKPVWTGKLALAPEHILLEPLRRTKPKMWFVNSMSDLFHEDVPDEWIDRVFAIMAMCPQHTFQVLTKRSARMRAYFQRKTVKGYEPIDEDNELEAVEFAILHRMCETAGRFATLSGRSVSHTLPILPLRNVWLGVSAEDQRRADERIPDLLATPAAVRFVSAEPLLGPIEFDVPWPPGWQRPIDDVSDGIDALRYAGQQEHPLNWVIVGGESGPDARPMHPDWARSIRDQCRTAGVPFFFKQHGSWLVGEEQTGDDHCVYVTFQDGDEFHIVSDGHDIVFGGAQEEVAGPRRIWSRYAGWQGHLIKWAGKTAAGRLLDGRTWDEMPVQAGVSRQEITEPA